MKLSIILLLTFLSLLSFSQTQTKTIQHGGVTRNYRLYIPPSYDICSLHPLVFNLHGLSSNAAQQEFYTQFNKVAETEGIIVAYPDGINNEWNIDGAGVDDVGLISAMIDQLSTDYSVDLNRVYSIGMSMGGFMSYRLACELNDRIVAIASVTGLLANPNCRPGRPVPILQIHGTADPTVSFNGVDPTIQFWLQNNNCSNTPIVTNLPDINTSDASTATRSDYGSCDNDAEIVLYVITNGEHTWPDASIDIGITNRDFNANEVIWEFLQKFSFDDPIQNPCDSVTAIQAINTNFEYSIYPNPAINQVLVTSTQPLQDVTIILTDMFGKEVQQTKFGSSNTVTLQKDNLPGGIYFYSIIHNAAIIQSGKIIFE